MKKLKVAITALAQFFPNIHIFIHLFRPRLKSVSGGLQGVHDAFVLANIKTLALDLGCGSMPANRFRADKVFGVDLYESKELNVLKCKLGFERLPFEENSVDYLTAYDLLEHIPRYSDLSASGNAPFIFLMNECYRVLKKNGVFLSMTPVFPFLGAFQDPTHTNIMTVDTLRLYFSNEKFDIAQSYGMVFPPFTTGAISRAH